MSVSWDGVNKGYIKERKKSRKENLSFTVADKRINL